MLREIFLFLLIATRFASAQDCSNDEFYLQWKDQLLWTETLLIPSPENEDHAYTFYTTPSGVLKTGSLDLGSTGEFNVNLNMEFGSPKFREFFLESCTHDTVHLFIDDNNQVQDSYLSKFNFKVDILPLVNLNSVLKVLDYSESFKIKASVDDDSNVSNYFYPTSQPQKDNYLALLVNELNLKITEQVKNGYTGPITIDLGHHAAFACDLMKGKAVLTFVHSGERTMDFVKRFDRAQINELEAFYASIREPLAKIEDDKNRLFFIGYQYEKNALEFFEHEKEAVLLFGGSDDYKTKLARFLRAITSLAEVDGHLAGESLNESLQCSLSKSAKFYNTDKFTNGFYFKTQSLEDVKESK